MKEIRFLLVDDHPLFRQGMKALLSTERGFILGGEAGDREEALELLARERFDIVTVDITLRDRNGLDLVREISQWEEKPAILVLSMHDESVYAQKALESGALGYVMKYAPPETILGAVKTVLSGKVYLSQEVQETLLNARFGQPRQGEYSLIDRLSQRELEILRYIGQGFGASEIAEILNLSVKTIHTYRDHLKEKLNVASSTEIRRFAIKWYQSLNN